MKRKFAVAVVGSVLALSAPVFAQTATTPPAVPAAPTATVPATPSATLATPINVIVPEGYIVVSDWTVVTLDQLKGADVHGPEGKKIGNVEDAEMGGDGKISGIVADIGGFLGIGSHRALIGNDHAAIYKHSDGKVIVATDMTEEALKALPAYEKKS